MQLHNQLLHVLTPNPLKMDKDFSALFSEIKEDTTAYVTLRLKLFQLVIYEKSGRAMSFLLYGLMVLLVIFFAVLFLFLTLGVYLGELMHSTLLGMVSMAALYILSLCLLILFRKKIQQWVMNLFLAEITKNDDDDESNQSETA